MRSRSSILVLSAVLLLVLAIGLPAAIAQLSTPDDTRPPFPDDRYRPGLPSSGDDDDDQGDGDNGGGCNSCDQQVMVSGQVSCFVYSFEPGFVTRFMSFDGAVGISFTGPEMGFSGSEEFTGDAADAVEVCAQHFQGFLRGQGFTASEVWCEEPVYGYQNCEISYVYGGPRNGAVPALTQLVAEIMTADVH